MHDSNLVCLEHFCSLCETQADINIDLRNVGREYIRSLKTLSVTFLLIYVNLDPGVTESWLSRIMREVLMLN